MTAQVYTPILVIEQEESTASFGTRYYHLHGHAAIDPAGLDLDDAQRSEVAQNGGLLFARDWDTFKSGLRLHEVRIRTQADSDTIKQGRFYAFELGIHRGCLVTLRDIDVVRPTLQRLERKMVQAREAEGVTDDVALWMARVARAMGAKRIAVRRSDRDFGITGQRFRVMPIGEAVNYLHQIVCQWGEQAS